jgi:hypothetical protein
VSGRSAPVEMRQTASARRAMWVIAACVLLVGAVVWPIVDIGPTGETLWRMNTAHGVDTRDLLSIPLLLAGLYSVRRAVSVS